MKNIIVILLAIILISTIYYSVVSEENLVKNPNKEDMMKVQEIEVYRDLNREEDREQYINRVIEIKGTVEEVDKENNQLIFEAVEGKIVAILQKGENISRMMEEDQVTVRGIGVIEDNEEKVLKLVTSIILRNE